MCKPVKVWVWIVVAVAMSCLAPRAAAQQTMTYRDLVKRMTDLAGLAVLPEPGEKCAQWSSYDRASRYDERTGKYLNWAANDDGPHFIRKEGKSYVLAEMEGPGCIWRIWSARAEQGHVKIYLDGQEEPAVDLPFAAYFDGQHAPFNYPMLSYNLAEFGSRGQNLYYPVPYQKSCKVVADEGWGRYFQFTYGTFPRGTKVPTFSLALAAENAAALNEVDTFFRERLGTDPAGDHLAQRTESKTIRVAPGDMAGVTGLSGPRAITALRVKTKFKDREDQMSGLRKLVLRITWDDQEKPGVWCPLGDFFGSAPGVNFYKSLVTGMTEDGFYSYWYMPFARSAAVELLNDDTVQRQVDLEIVHAPLSRPFSGMGHFHAKWHRDTFPLPEDRWPDWCMLRTQGRGRYCGVMLHVWNPRGGWWGEGDEKFFVNGEKFPSTFGTGSEDYFGYAWCDPHLFQRPYHAQTMTQNNKGHQSVLRWQILDNVPLVSSFEGCIEKYFKNEEKGTLYACVACWYLSPDGVDPYQPVAAAQRDGYYVKPELVAGGFKVLGDPPGEVQTQNMIHFGAGKWKKADQLWWAKAKPGDKLEVAVPVDSSGTYQVSVMLTKARNYAIVQLYLDGNKAGNPIDLYSSQVVPTDLIPLGVHRLTKGEHVLGVEIVGANDKADKLYTFGLDWVSLKLLP